VTAPTIASPVHHPRLHLVPTSAPLPTPVFSVAGLDVSALRPNALVQLLLDAPKQYRRLRVHFADVSLLVESAKDAVLREALSEADIVAPGARALVWCGRLKGHRLERVAAPETMHAVLERGCVEGYRHFFYGCRPEALEQLAIGLTGRFPGIQVAGVYATPSHELNFQDAEDVARLINEAEPDYVWVGLDSPRQEMWLAEFRPLLHAPVMLAVGAAFDRLTGAPATRTSAWTRRLGLQSPMRLLARLTRVAAS
jgi:N-acetylglucosaminyldiphosphoundecaprenol N-acetyl-beta-D-mannosaminyltransferase